MTVPMGDAGDPVTIRVWHTALFTRAVCLVLLVATGSGGLLVLAVAAWPTPNTSRVDGFVFGTFLCLWAVAMWRCGLHARIEATPEGLVVRNPVRTRRVPWAEVVDVQPSYSGLDITGSAGTVTAWAVQQANISEWLRRRSRSVVVAEQILELARAHQTPKAPCIEPPT